MVDLDQIYFTKYLHLTAVNKIMEENEKREIRKAFGEYLKEHRINVLKIKSALQLSYDSNIDNSKLNKIEKGLVSIEFDTLLEIAETYKLTHESLLGFNFQVQTKTKK